MVVCCRKTIGVVEAVGKWKIRRIFQGRAATGFSTACLSRQTELLQTNGSQRTVRTNPVAVDPPGLDAAPGVDGLIQDIVFCAAQALADDLLGEWIHAGRGIA